VISIRHVSVSRGGRRVLSSVTGDLPQIGLLALVGPNGSGKSTFLESLSGLAPISSGQLIDSAAGLKLSANGLKHRCAYLHQRLVLPAQTSPREYLECIHRWARFRHTSQVSESNSDASSGTIMSLENLESRNLELFSWGQRRVVALAGVVATRKPILLLDEPYSGLHPSLANQVTDLLKQLCARRLVVLAEHDLQLVEVLSEVAEVWIFRDGRIAAKIPAGRFVRSSILEFFDGV